MKKRVLLPTKDNHIIVLDIDYDSASDLADKVFTAKKYFLKHAYNEYVVDYNARKEPFYSQIGLGINLTNTEFLNEELNAYTYVRRREEYKNQAQTNEYKGSLPPLFPDIDYSVPDDKVPEIVKSLGYTIKYEEVLCDVMYDKKTNSYKNKNPSFSMSIDTDSRIIYIYREHINLPLEDISRISEIVADYKEKHKNSGISFNKYIFKHLYAPHDIALANLYNQQFHLNTNNAHLLYHEVKHLQNAIFHDSLYLNKGNIRLSISDAYKLAVEDERSAYLSQVINSINIYLEKGDFDDFSMFDSESYWLVNKLQKLPGAEQRKTYVQNFPEIVNGEMQCFNDSHFTNYQKQFNADVEIFVNTAPMAAIEDKNHELFKKIQRQYYLFQIYNPDSGKMEYRNLFDYMSEENQVKEKSFPLFEAKLFKRKAIFSAKKMKLDLSLLEPARKMMLENSKNPYFVHIDEAISIASIEKNPHKNVEIPSDKANWSDNLQKYWQKFEGYQEINKNNYEYSFKIKNDIIRYTEKNKVEIGNNNSYESYVKLLQEPTNSQKDIIFKQTLSKEQALYLYIACTLQNRKMKGSIPTDFRDIDKLKGIPADKLSEFKAIMKLNSTKTPLATQVISTRRTFRSAEI